MKYDLMVILLLYYIVSVFYLEKDYRKISSFTWEATAKLTIKMLAAAVIIFIVISTKDVLLGLSVLAVMNLLNLILKKSLSERFSGDAGNRKRYFIVEQICFVLAILFLSMMPDNMDSGMLIIKHDYFNRISLIKYNRLIVSVLIIFRPINTVFTKLFGQISPYLQNGEESDFPQVGALIGNLERLLVLIFLINNQYTAVGLIFTAKTIIRFDEFSNNKAFTEYYMLGTLFSMISVLLVYIVLF